MKTLFRLGIASFHALLLAASSFAANGLIVRVNPTVINSVAKQYGLKVEKQLKSQDGVYLVSVPSGASATVILQALQTSPLVSYAEANLNVNLTKRPTSARQLSKGQNCAPTALVMGKLRYISQTAVGITCLADAQKHFGNGSPGVHVAVIDTAIDSKHPVLAGVLDVGYDAVNDRKGPINVNQETSPFVDQETSPFVDGGGNIVVNQETSPFVDQETSPFVDQETSPFVDKIPAWIRARHHGRRHCSSCGSDSAHRANSSI